MFGGTSRRARLLQFALFGDPFLEFRQRLTRLARGHGFFQLGEGASLDQTAAQLKCEPSQRRPSGPQVKQRLVAIRINALHEPQEIAQFPPVLVAEGLLCLPQGRLTSLGDVDLLGGRVVVGVLDHRLQVQHHRRRVFHKRWLGEVECADLMPVALRRRHRRL